MIVYCYDFENSKTDDIIAELLRNKYYKFAVYDLETATVNDWSDDHVMNKHETNRKEWFDQNKDN